MDVKPKFKPIVVIQSYEEREASVRQFPPPPKATERRSTLSLSETLREKPLPRHSLSGAIQTSMPAPTPSASALLPSTTLTSVASPPPPPPPPPFEDGNIQNTIPQQLNNQQTRPKSKIAPPVPVKYSTLSFSREKQDFPQPPPCPSPDYDTISINSNSTLSKAIANRFAACNESNKTSQSQNNINFNSNNYNETVEMESLESFRLNNPTNSRPKPPNTYFKKSLSSQLSNGSTCSTVSGKKQRPVSVTIGEYPSGSLRKQPGKLDFLQNGEDAERNCNGSISSQFATELAHTLSRSNLRKRTESVENLLNDPSIKPQSNGSVTISLNNTLSRNFAKSTENLNNFRTNDSVKSNRVTISISSGDKKLEAAPNGILKNGNGNHNFHNSHHKPLVQQKSITFGEM